MSENSESDNQLLNDYMDKFYESSQESVCISSQSRQSSYSSYSSGFTNNQASETINMASQSRTDSTITIASGEESYFQQSQQTSF